MIFLHIGLQKTGTTSLQFSLQELQLLKFPLNKVRYINCNNKKIYTSGNQSFYQDCVRNKFNLKDLEENGIKNSIITCENFTDPYASLIGLKNLIKFLESKNIDYEIIYTNRDFDEYAESLYSEFVINSFACEMRSFKIFKKYLKKHIHNLENLISSLKVKRFTYSENINNEIIDYICGENIYTNKIYNNKRKSSIKYDINYLQSIANKNRIYGWIPTYRKNLRKKHKEDILNAPLIYLFLTYIRSLIRFLISKTN